MAKKSFNRVSLLAVMFGAMGGMKPYNEFKTSTEKACMGRKPRENRWTKPIFKKVDGKFKRVGIEKKSMSGEITRYFYGYM